MPSILSTCKTYPSSSECTLKEWMPAENSGSCASRWTDTADSCYSTHKAPSLALKSIGLGCGFPFGHMPIQLRRFICLS